MATYPSIPPLGTWRVDESNLALAIRYIRKHRALPLLSSEPISFTYYAIQTALAQGGIKILGFSIMNASNLHFVTFPLRSRNPGPP